MWLPFPYVAVDAWGRIGGCTQRQRYGDAGAPPRIRHHGKRAPGQFHPLGHTEQAIVSLLAELGPRRGLLEPAAIVLHAEPGHVLAHPEPDRYVRGTRMAGYVVEGFLAEAEEGQAEMFRQLFFPFLDLEVEFDVWPRTYSKYALFSAARNGGNRRSTTQGYRDSVAYVKGRLQAAGYTVVDLFARWQPLATDRFELFAGVYNLFDRSYRAHASVADYTAIPDYELVAGLNEPGRNFRLGATVRF